MEVFKSYVYIHEVIVRVFQHFGMAARCRGRCINLCKDMSAEDMGYVVDNTKHVIWIVLVDNGNGPVLSILSLTGRPMNQWHVGSHYTAYHSPA